MTGEYLSCICMGTWDLHFHSLASGASTLLCELPVPTPAITLFIITYYGIRAIKVTLYMFLWAKPTNLTHILESAVHAGLW